MMIEDEIYGMMPSAKIVKRLSAPPENMLNRPRIPPCWDWNSSASRIGSMPGTGMCAPIRNTTNARSRNVRRFLRSPNLPVLPSCGVAIFALPPFLPSGPGRVASRLSLPSRFSLPWPLSFAPRSPSASLVFLASPARFSAPASPLPDLASACGWGAGTALGSRFGLRCRMGPSAGHRVEAALGQPALQRHLPALEAHLVKAPGACPLALVTAAARFARPRPDAARNALAHALGAGSGFQRIEFHLSLDAHQVSHAVDHAAHLRRVLELHGLTQPPQPQAAHRGAMLLLAAVGAFDERHANFLVVDMRPALSW